ncbi:MAG: hypothetical protein IJM30_05000, partial [Thermoguttaceae bacterium]|nr:hypothetical protein [Thermoguttaceae bacterium]
MSHVADRSQKLIDRGLAYDALQVMRPFAADVLTLRDGSPDLFDAKQRETVSEEEPEEEYEEEK